MTLTSKTPQEAIGEAVALLQVGPGAPLEGELRERIALVMDCAVGRLRQDQMNADHDAARKVIRSAAEAILKAMKTVSLYSESNIEDPDRFERELEALTRLGVQKTSIVIQKGQRGAGQTAILANPRPKRTRPKLQSVVVMLHSAAVELLTHAGLTPTTGTGANVARLGALLCVAAGVPLMSGESTKAARLACSPRELLADSGITFQEVLPNLNP